MLPKDNFVLPVTLAATSSMVHLKALTVKYSSITFWQRPRCYHQTHISKYMRMKHQLATYSKPEIYAHQMEFTLQLSSAEHTVK